MGTLLAEKLTIATEEKIGIDYGLVSIIMPNYNSEKYIKETIESVINQEYKNWELIIVDDCSSDNSVEVIKQFDDERIRLYLNESNSGAAVTRNNAIEKANGRWIAFLDSDDLWDEKKLVNHISFMHNNSIPFSFTSYNVVNEKDDKRVVFAPKKDEYNYKDILKHCYIGCSTVVCDADKIGKPYMPTDAAKREDFACWLAILRNGTVANCFHENLTTYRVRNNSVSSSKLKIIKYQWRVYRKVEHLSVFKSFYYMIHWAIKGVFKYR